MSHCTLLFGVCVVTGFLVLTSVVVPVYGGNNTVTHECFFDVIIEDDGDSNTFKGRIVIALFGHAAPISVLNFRSLCDGFSRPNDLSKLHYKGSGFHRVVPDFVIQGGDVDGNGGRSVYGLHFDDEHFIHSHRTAGYVSWTNHGPDTNGSQFFITLVKARWLDNKHVAFGKVIGGMGVVHQVSDVATDHSTAIPSARIKIINSGTLDIPGGAYDISEHGMASDVDLSDIDKLPPTSSDCFTKEGAFKPSSGAHKS